MSPPSSASGSGNPALPRLLFVTTWADDGRWEFLNLLRERGYRADLLEPLFLRSKWAPGWLKNLSRKLCSWYQPFLALAKARNYEAVITWNTRMGTFHGIVARLFPPKKRPLHFLRDFHLDITRAASPAYQLRILLVRLAVPGVDMFFTTSVQESRLYADMFSIPANRILFFPDNPDWSFTERVAATEGNYVFAYGNSDRDFDTLLKAARNIPTRVILLSQAFKPEASLPENVIFISYRLPQKELIEYIARARVVVVPLKSPLVAAGQNAMLEIMSLARPVVVTKNVSTREHATDGQDALFVPPREPRALAEAVNRLLADPALARTLGENARRTAMDMPGRQVEVFQRALRRLLPSIEENGRRRTLPATSQAEGAGNG